MHRYLSSIAELNGQVGPVRPLEPPTIRVNNGDHITLQRLFAAHDIVVSSGDTGIGAGAGCDSGSKAVLRLRFFAFFAGAMRHSPSRFAN